MKTSYKIATTLFLAVLLVTLQKPAHANTDRNAKLEVFLQQQLEVHKVAGVAIARIEDGKIAHQAAFGVTSTETGTPLSQNTVFQAASISKAVTAWGIMRLVQEGRLELDAPISRYLTRWHLPPSTFNANEVTLRRVLAHTAGLSLPSYVGFDPDKELPTFEASLSGDTAGSGSLELVATPGSIWAYSGGGYTLLGLIIEEVSGVPFADYMQTHIFDPLGMTSSSYLPDDTLLSRTAQAHDFHLNPIPNYRLAAQGAGSLHTTAGDLARFAIANMSNNPVLNRKSLDDMHTPVIQTGHGNQMGLGFFIEGGGQLIGHSGSNRGWKARIQFRPASRDGLIVLSNSESGEALVDDIFCHWNDAFQIRLLSASCADKQKQLDLLKSVGWLSTTLIASITLALLMRLLANILLNNQAPAFPMPNEWQFWVFGLIFILALGHCLFFYTGLGVWLIAGIPWGFSIKDHAPAPVQYAFHALLGFYIIIAASMLVRLRKPQ